ncbi:Modification methylase BabI [Parafrankia sp. Ea1.12]|nr:Modification methylase BabI [Parafrankia sp. Ea1.12]
MWGEAVRKARITKPIVKANSIVVQELFDGRTYQLDAFQRSYAWERPQIEELIGDLAGKFLRQWEDTDNYGDVDQYDPYFLGSIIVYRQNGQTYLADGQQRVTTLLLLLIQLYKIASHRDDVDDLRMQLGVLIRGGRPLNQSFAVRVENLEPYFAALLADHQFGIDAASPDIRRVWDASNHILACCPAQIKEDLLPYFGRWLLHRVSLVEMDAGDRERGQEMFSTMNDRGVRLAPLDHLKNYLFSDARDDLDKLDVKWRSMVTALEAVDRNGPLEFVRAALHARYFDVDPSEESERAREQAPHEWLSRHEDDLWPARKNGSRVSLLTDWLEPLHGRYLDLLRAAGEYRTEFEAIWFNARNGVTRQFDLTLVAARTEDTEAVFLAKARLVANFVDLFVVTRGLSGESYGSSDLAEVIDPLLPRVRESRTTESLSRELGTAAAGWYERFEEISSMGYREGGNRNFLLYFLARLTAWLERGTERHERADRMLTRTDGRRPYEIEHLFTRKPGIYDTGTLTGTEFKKLRSRLGGLVLLDGEENASIGSMSLVDKMEIYPRFNWLAASVSPSSHEGRGKVKFRKFVAAQNLQDKFIPYNLGDSVQSFIDKRAELYRAMAERIWSPAALGLTIFSPQEDVPVPAHAGGKTRRSYGVTVADLLRAGLVFPEEGLIAHGGGAEHRATVLANGRIRTASGSSFTTPSGAAADARGVGCNGWEFWKVERNNQKLDAVRRRFRSPA